MCLQFRLLSIALVCSVLVIVRGIPAQDTSNNGNDEEETESNEHGYSFHKFTGPVSGEIQPIYVPDGDDGTQKLDYYANPDYSYAYGVQDPKTGNTHEHQETRHGDAVQGQYSVLQADGATRVVKYTADATNGFQAIVEYH